ncbi:phosphatase PAP2 family protein [Polaribacter batillariae]|uniref:Phosphatase PAP2 family protein n=1 Tax=Polaribacter batillariae TaxID=2808900 RepID=A0ABX7SUN6_9FLAO|nr:phosphatase PAP2 family protein [Polaribacter batillariae]QTD37945.1 phosphatase PAP2 family protein [Polaribacter batillariae]
MRIIIAFTTVLLLSQISFGQQNASPYEWKWKRDGIWTGAAFAASAGGLLIISSKDTYSDADLAQIRSKINDINFIDRWVAGNYSESANTLSDVPFAFSFVAPFALLLDKKARNNSGQLFGIYIESLATTSALFTITAGLSNRSRPYTYGTEAPLEQRKSITATRSFYSGHVAATATATFFAAKVYQDFNPDSPAIPYIYAGAAILPAAVGYFRMQAGQHFLTDVLLGYGLGALAGYYIPELHKKKSRSFSFQPIMDQNFYGENYQGICLRYQF